jgi:hypothetical protein
MWSGTCRGCLISLLFVSQLAVFAETTDHDESTSGPAPLQRPAGETSAASLDELKANVKEKQTAGTASWWKSVHDLLGKLTPEEASALTGEIPEGKRKNLFRFASQARQAEAKALKEMARNRAAPEASEAAAQELQRRLQDPLTRFLAEHFSLRPELAMEMAEKLKKAENDPQEAAKLLARLMGTLNRSQREALMKAAGSSAEGVSAKLMKWIADAALVSLGGNADTPFKQAFKAAYDGVLDRNRQFEQLLSNTLSGDTKSRDKLVQQFGKDAVLDFISSQLRNGNDGLAVDLAKAVARKDANGNLFLDLNPDNAALASDTKGQSLFLGNEKANENIRAALTAFDTSNAKDHGDTTSFDPGTKGRLQQFSLGSSPSEGGRRVFAAQGADGQPKLSDMAAGDSAPSNLASQPIQQVKRLPDVKPLETEPVPEPKKEETKKPKESEKPVSNAGQQFVDFIKTNCTKCHQNHPEGLPNGKIKKEGAGTLTIAQALLAINTVPKMKAGVPAKVKAELAEFAKKLGQ